MQARVKQDSRYGVITAFSGCEYVKTEWRVVPAGQEAAAMQHPYLEVQQIGLDVLQSLPSFVEERAPVEYESLPEIKPDEPIIERVVEPIKQPRKRGKK